MPLPAPRLRRQVPVPRGLTDGNDPNRAKRVNISSCRPDLRPLSLTGEGLPTDPPLRHDTEAPRAAQRSGMPLQRYTSITAHPCSGTKACPERDRGGHLAVWPYRAEPLHPYNATTVCPYTPLRVC